MRKLAKFVGIGLGLLLLAAGALSLAVARAPGAGWALGARDGVVELAIELHALGVAPAALAAGADGALAHPLAQYGLAPLGLVLLVGLLLPGRSRVPPLDPEQPDVDPLPESLARLERKAQKKSARHAAGLARAGRGLEAAECYFEAGLMEEAARQFLEAGEPVRAAEIRHDQQRFIEAAELYLQAGDPESAGSIFARQEEWLRAAEAYEQANDRSVAAEMFEKAEEWLRAAACYEASDFPRHAARAYMKCRRWAKAAHCLEAVVAEAQTGAAHGDPRRVAELQKIVRMGADLWQRAGEEERAEALLERTECWAEAGELALRGGRREKAAELFLRARDAARAAEVLRLLGRDAEADQVLGEYHRDRGDELEAAQHLEAAGDYLAAGDLYRLIERGEDAGRCYQEQGEYVQAAEMYRGLEDLPRAAENYARAESYSEAAECWREAGDRAKEAELWAQAGEHYRAGRILADEGRDEEAIAALQKVEPGSSDQGAATALLGELFRRQGKLSLAQKKLGDLVGQGELNAENVRAWYELATVHEAREAWDEARELYEKILAFDYQFEDVGERLERCRQASSAARERDASPLSGARQQGRYAIEGPLGRGGMGVVYKARDTVLDRTVAFKVLPDTFMENPQALKNFLREAKSAARLNHPNIVTVYDAGEQDGAYYIAMEYVDGHTLKEIVKHKGRISAKGCLHVLTQMCEALAYAHENKIVHRDIKTANTMWTRDRKAKIMDFGLARAVEEVRNHTTVVSGTPYYMSPEQTLGKNVDHRTDLYSLGVTLFELMTGTLPFREGNLPYHHVHTPPPDPRERAPDVSPRLAEVALRCLRKKPEERYQSAGEILAELRS